MKLNLGCGALPLKGYINIDKYHSGPYVDRKDDVEDLCFDNSTVDEIYASHILEHFGVYSTADVLREWWRVLKPGGKLSIYVPNTELICNEYLSSTERLKTGISIYGGDTVNFHGIHKIAFDDLSLKVMLEGCGFKVDYINGTSTRRPDAVGAEIECHARKVIWKNYDNLIINAIKNNDNNRIRVLLSDNITLKRYYTVQCYDAITGIMEYDNLLPQNNWVEPYKISDKWRVVVSHGLKNILYDKFIDLKGELK